MRTSSMLLSVFFALLLHFSGTQAEFFRVPKATPVPIKNNRSLYIVYMGHANPTVEPNKLQNNALIQVLGNELAAEESLIYSYNNGFRGLAAMLSDEQAEQMRSKPNVVSVFLSKSISIQTTASYSFVGFSTTEGVWPESNFGENTIVGILDTGIWPESASFKDEGMTPIPSTWKGSCVKAPEFGPENCNKKLIGAKFYAKGYEAIYGPIVTGDGEFRSPRDSIGHGTHTASTVAGRTVANTSLFGLGAGTVTGGAPKARLAAYKVCWANDCASADILAAFDDAIKDGVNVISMSLGGFPADYQDDSLAIGSFHAVANGILVSASAGNSGPFRGTVSNLAPWMTTVAASTINRQFLAKVLLGNGKTYEGAVVNTFVMKPGKMYPLVYAGDIPVNGYSGLDSSFCLQDSFDKAAAKGKIVVCYIGGGTSDDYVFEAGGVGIILINEDYKQIGFEFSLPAGCVDQVSGDKILSYINSTRAPTGRIEASETVFNKSPAPVTAVFSSRGPNTITADILKPDITAPGVDILAAWSPVLSLTESIHDNRTADYNIISGTSMSCPHVSASAAIIKSLHPDWSPSAIKSALMTTATPLDESLSDGDLGLSVGSGQINPAAFADPGLVYDITTEEYEKFLCAVGYTTKQLRLVTGDNSVCPKVAPKVLDLNYPSIFVSANRSTVQKMTRTVTNVGPVVSTYKVTVVAPEGVEITVTPTTLSFDSTNKEKSYTVNMKMDTPSDEYVFGSITWSDGSHNVRIPVGVGPPLLFS